MVGAPTVASASAQVVPNIRQVPARDSGIPDAPAASRLEFEESGIVRPDDQARLTILDTVARKNFRIEFRLKAATGYAETLGGVAIRLTESGNYYVLKVDMVRKRIAFIRKAGGRATEIIGVDTDISPDAWFTFVIQVEDGRFAVSLDGRWLFTAYDEALRQPGRIALWRTPGSAGLRFDPVAILPLPTAGPPL
jgi:hypothetical protein